jgi:hypothetical protein
MHDRHAQHYNTRQNHTAKTQVSGTTATSSALVLTRMGPLPFHGEVHNTTDNATNKEKLIFTTQCQDCS